METNLRREDGFKLGQIHGKIQADNKDSEAQIQRVVFLSQKIQLYIKRDTTISIRLLGYEVPLMKGVSRGKCVDLIGYDKEHNLYLIELKKGASQEKIKDIETQIDDYENMIKKILPNIVEEFKKEYFLSIEFANIKKIILAPIEFYQQKYKELTRSDIYYCYFRDRKIIEKANKHNWKPVGVSLYKKIRQCN